MLVCEAVTWQRLLYSCFFRGRCLSTGVHATIYFRLRWNLLSCPTSLSLHVSAVYGHRQVHVYIAAIRLRKKLVPKHAHMKIPRENEAARIIATAVTRDV
jgi:hypothetical protein